MCMADGGDRPTVYRSNHPCSRKARECDECRRTIAAGERYRYHFGVYEGFVFSGATCSHCEVAVSWLGENCGGYLHGAVLEDLREHIGEYPSLGYGLARVVVGARRQWKSFSDPAKLLPIQPMPKSIESFVHA